MFALTNTKGLTIGGGGSPAIWVDGDFNRGSSGKSKTFNSRCLASDESFTCIHLEVWGTIEDVQLGVQLNHSQTRESIVEQMTSDRVRSHLRESARRGKHHQPWQGRQGDQGHANSSAGAGAAACSGRTDPVAEGLAGGLAGQGSGVGPQEEREGGGKQAGGGGQAGANVGGALLSAMSMLRSAVGYAGGGAGAAEGGATQPVGQSLGEFVAQCGVAPGGGGAGSVRNSPAHTVGVRDVFYSPMPVTPESHTAHAQQPLGGGHGGESARPPPLDASCAAASPAAAARTSLELWNDVMVFLPEILAPSSGPSTPDDASSGAVATAAGDEDANGRGDASGGGERAYDARKEEKRRFRRCKLWSKDEVRGRMCVLCVCVGGVCVPAARPSPRAPACPAITRTQKPN